MINELIQMYFVLQFIEDVNSMGEGDPKKLAKIEPSQILMIPKHWSLNFFSLINWIVIMLKLWINEAVNLMKILPAVILF